jgi:addiction module HigA family antidote
MVFIPTNRPPTHPGEMLRDEFLIPMNISQRDLANAIHVPYQRINELVNQKHSVPPKHGFAFSQVFRSISGFLAQPADPMGSIQGANRRKNELYSIQNFHA